MRTSTLRPSSTLLSHSRLPPRLAQIPLNRSFPHAPNPTHNQTRTLFDSLLSSTLGPAPQRHLTHTQTLDYPPALLFKVVSNIDLYPSFLPFTISSEVTSRDSFGYPTRARLKVGYDKFGLEEDWDSVVRCDPESGVVEARSAEPQSEGLFEVLRTRWEIKPVGGEGSEAKLDLHLQFRNPVYDQMFTQVEGKVARAVIAAFEKRVGELDRRKGA